STALIYRQRHAGRTVGVYFSGDTIVHPRYWGQTALHRSVIATLLRWKVRHPLTPLHWYLICSGYRTYLTLVRNFPGHLPHHERAVGGMAIKWLRRALSRPSRRAPVPVAGFPRPTM